jgi:hypothetical protein
MIEASQRMIRIKSQGGEANAEWFRDSFILEVHLGRYKPASKFTYKILTQRLTV